LNAFTWSRMARSVGRFSAVVQADDTGVGTWQSDPATLITFRKVADGNQSVDKVFTVDRTPAPIGEGVPSVLHCAAVGSPVDVYPTGDSYWGVTGRSGFLDYTRQGPALEVQGGGVLPPVTGSLLVQYSGLGDAQSLTVFGTGSCQIVPKAGGASGQGTGLMDASGLAGSLLVQADGSLATVLLGSGPCIVQGSSDGDFTRYVLNSRMVDGRTVFSSLRLGADKLNLGGFGTVSGLGGLVKASFDNLVPDGSVYQRFTHSVEVFFDADSPGGHSHHRFEVLVAEDTSSSPEELVSRVLSSVETHSVP
jgi:hypothetical protein